MTGHFFCIGIPEEFETFPTKNGQGAKFKFGFFKFQTFSTTVIDVITNASGAVMVSGEYKEREYNGSIYTDASVTAAKDMSASAKPKQQHPQTEQTPTSDGWPF